MSQVTGEYPDYTSRTLKSNFYLDADQGFNPYTWTAPIQWGGTVKGKRVKFTQIQSDALSQECFDWEGFPEELNDAKAYIVEAIDNAMRTMD